MSEPLSSNQRCEQHGSERCCITAECEVRWQRDEIERLTRENESLGEQVLAERRMEREVEKLRHELDNERAAMRNVQECAESYRRERDAAIKQNMDDVAECNVELERLRGALHEARHVMRWEMGYQDGGRNIANADKVCAKIDSLIGVADETKP